MGRKGGMTKASRARYGRTLGIGDAEAQALGEHLAPAAEWYRVTSADLARDIGGGHLSSGVASLVASSALQLGASRKAFADGDAMAGSRLANDSRQNLIAAHDLAGRDAQHRRQREELARGARTGLARLQAAITTDGAGKD